MSEALGQHATRAARRMLVCALVVTLTGVAPPALTADTQPYAALQIESPAADATVHDNTGTVRIVVRLSPPLRVDQGDRLMLWLDGRALAQMAGAEHRLANLDRGTHSVQVRVVDRQGATLMQSDPVVFHLRRASRLMPGRDR